MRAIDVFISAKDKRGLIRRALRAFHSTKEGNEYIEAALVRVGIGQYHIERLVKLKITKCSNDELDVDVPDLKAKQQAAEANGLMLITIHSHPNLQGLAPSKHDHIDGIADNEPIMGIIEIWQDKSGRTHTDLTFWQPQLPCKLHVIKEQ